MKRTSAILFVTVLVLLITGCSAKKSNSVSLYDKGLELTNQLDGLAQDTDYINLLSGTDALINQAAEIGSQDFSNVKEVYEIYGVEDSIMKLMTEQTDVQLSEQTMDIVKDKLAISLTNRMNGSYGTAFLATTSMLTVNDNFLYEGLDEIKFYLYVYDGIYSSMVTFVPYGDNIVGATANIIQTDTFSEPGSEEDVSAYFAEMLLMTDVKVKKIK